MDQSEYISRSDLACTLTGLCEIDEEVMAVLEDVRRLYDRQMRLSSAYRDKWHPTEGNKKTTGMLNMVRAVDILVWVLM